MAKKSKKNKIQASLSQEELRVKKNDEMFRSLEAAIFMHIDDQPDAIYFGALLLTAARNMFMQFLPLDRTIDIFETMVTDLKTGKTPVTG